MDAGVDVTAESWPGMVHGWQGLVTAGVPEAVAAFARARAPTSTASGCDQAPRMVRSSERRRSGSARMSSSDDLPAAHREGADRERHPVAGGHGPGDTVDERRLRQEPELGVDHRPAGHLGRTAHRTGGPTGTGTGTGRDGALVGAHNHVGVEDGEERLEVAVTRRSQEGVDHLALAAARRRRGWSARPECAGGPGWPAGGLPRGSAR